MRGKVGAQRNKTSCAELQSPLKGKQNKQLEKGRINPNIKYEAPHKVLLDINSSILDPLISRTGRCEPFHQLDCSGLTLNRTPTAAALSVSASEEVASSSCLPRKPLRNVLLAPHCNNTETSDNLNLI